MIIYDKIPQPKTSAEAVGVTAHYVDLKRIEVVESLVFPGINDNGPFLYSVVKTYSGHSIAFRRIDVPSLQKILGL